MTFEPWLSFDFIAFDLFHSKIYPQPHPQPTSNQKGHRSNKKPLDIQRGISSTIQNRISRVWDKGKYMQKNLRETDCDYLQIWLWWFSRGLTSGCYRELVTRFLSKYLIPFCPSDTMDMILTMWELPRTASTSLASLTPSIERECGGCSSKLVAFRK